MSSKFLRTFLVLLVFLPTLLLAQETSYNAFLIPQELKENANAVVRNHHTAIEVLSVNKMRIKVDRVVTVLNKYGDNKIDAVVGYDNNSKITYLSAIIYDASGK